MRIDRDFVSSHTKYKVSFLVSLGYKVEKIAKGKGGNRNDDRFAIYSGDKRLLYKKGQTTTANIRRTDFYNFAKERHASLRHMKAVYKIYDY